MSDGAVKITLAVAVFVGLLVVKGCYDRSAEAQGRFRERLRVADSAITALTRRLQEQDVAYRADTLRLRESLVAWGRVRERVITRWRRDTLILRDTTVVRDTIVTLPEVVAVADTVIRACQDALGSCESRVLARDSLILHLRREIALAGQLRPAARHRWAERVAWAALVLVVSR